MTGGCAAGLSYVRTFHMHFDDPLPGSEQGEVEYAITRATMARRIRTRSGRA